MSLKLVFMGTPEFAAVSLAKVLKSSHEVVAAYSQPPRPAGRGMAPRKSPVQILAEAHDLPTRTPASLRDGKEQDAFAALGADVAVVVAYGLLLPRAVLDAPRLGSFNLHASALPRWRGAAPIQRAILAGDTETAVIVMRMGEGLDTGPVCLSRRVPIGPDTTAGELHDEMAELGAGLLVEALGRIEQKRLDCTPQSEEGVVYAAKIAKAEARLDLTKPASEVHNTIRGLSPFPGAWLTIPDAMGSPERIKVLRSRLVEGAGPPGMVIDDQLTIACADGAVRLIEVQRAGKRPVPAAEFLRGFALPAGTRVNQP